MHGKVSTIMNRVQTMLKISKITSLATKTIVTVLSLWLITACSQTDIIVLDKPVNQVNNLEDYDSDGVIKAREKCDGTVLGATIDNYGCGTQTASTEMVNIDIKFASNSAVIPTSAISEIQKLADILNLQKGLQVKIEGHTSKTGGVVFNQELSEARSKAVATILINDFNIAQERVTSIGYGYQKLADTSGTDEAHSVNRRIIANLSYKKYIDDMKWTIYSVAESL